MADALSRVSVAAIGTSVADLAAASLQAEEAGVDGDARAHDDTLHTPTLS